MGAIIDACIATMSADNEDNAMLATRLMLDIQKTYRSLPVMEEKVGALFGFIERLLVNVQEQVKDIFDEADMELSPMDGRSRTHSESGLDSEFSTASEADDGGEGKLLRRGDCSFKVLGESPILVVLMFQIYKGVFPTIGAKLVPQYIQILSYRARLQEAAQADAQSEGVLFTGIAPNVPNRALYHQLIEAQVRALSFLAYILRTLGSSYRDQAPEVAKAVVNLLLSCPTEAITTRKVRCC